MMKKIKMPESIVTKPSTLNKIDVYAMEKGMTKRQGNYYKDGKFYGNFLKLGKEAGVF